MSSNALHTTKLPDFQNMKSVRLEQSDFKYKLTKFMLGVMGVPHKKTRHLQSR